MKSKTIIVEKALKSLAFRTRKLKGLSNFLNIWGHNLTRKYIDSCLKQMNFSGAQVQKNYEKIIWFAWLQGIDNAPELVQKCYQSIISNMPSSYEIKIITLLNFQEYTDINPLLIKKYQTGKISNTQFSDILRFNLLKNHGGIWIDSTVFIAKKIQIPDKLDDKIYTVKRKVASNVYVSKGLWAGNFIGGGAFDFYCFMDQAFSFWITNDFTNYFFLIDYLIDYAYRNNIGHIKDYLFELDYNNENYNLLLPMLNERYDESSYFALLKENFAFKLSNKKKLDDNKDTYYSKIVKRALN